MFYCEACRKAKNWPEGMSRSYGRCEVCKFEASCYDVPSSRLPMPPAPSPHERAVALLKTMEPDDRKRVFSEFCTHCGSDDPGCVCWNDE